MITEVNVDGYRSLRGLKIPLCPGLNILVGPNGGGKTNVLSFFEFISKLCDTPVDEAVSSHGGIGRVFTRISESQYDNKLKATIRGNLSFPMQNRKLKRLWYIWEFEISTSETYEEIILSRQKFYIDLESEKLNPEDSDLILSTNGTSGLWNIAVDKINVSKVQQLFRGFQFLNVGTYIDKKEASNILQRYARIGDPSRQFIMTCFTPQLTVFSRIVSDIRGGEIFNFVPEICKQPEDTSRPPVIDKNGAGLASTLHRLGQPQNFNPFRRLSYRGVNPDHQKLAKISMYLRIISPAITNITTHKNAIDNTISVVVSVGKSGESVPFPLSQCSDGTVKWIALLTKIITATSGFSIEEPENFLHPNVQKEFLQVVRAESERNARSPYTMITTHSESLLNEARPEEVILVWMEDAKTAVKRVSNSEELTSEISRTGFGLGYYYVTGALESA